MTTPGPELLKEVRAGFTIQGTSLRAFCRDNGLTYQNVYAALRGGWSGPKARELVLVTVEASKAVN